MPLLELEPNPWLVSYGIFLGLPPKITTARPPRVRAHTRLTLFRLALTTALYTHLTAARPREASERLFWRVRRGAWPQAQRAGARQSAGVVASCAGSVGKILVQQAFNEYILYEYLLYYNTSTSINCTSTILVLHEYKLY